MTGPASQSSICCPEYTGATIRPMALFTRGRARARSLGHAIMGRHDAYVVDGPESLDFSAKRVILRCSTAPTHRRRSRPTRSRTRKIRIECEPAHTRPRRSDRILARIHAVGDALGSRKVKAPSKLPAHRSATEPGRGTAPMSRERTEGDTLARQSRQCAAELPRENNAEHREDAMRRRELFKGAAASLAAFAAPRIGRAEKASKLVYVPGEDLSVLDPVIGGPRSMRKPQAVRKVVRSGAKNSVAEGAAKSACDLNKRKPRRGITGVFRLRRSTWGNRSPRITNSNKA